MSTPKTKKVKRIKVKAWGFVSKNGDLLNWAMTTKNLREFYETVEVTKKNRPDGKPPRGFRVVQVEITLLPKPKTRK